MTKKNVEYIDSNTVADDLSSYKEGNESASSCKEKVDAETILVETERYMERTDIQTITTEQFIEQGTYENEYSRKQLRNATWNEFLEHECIRVGFVIRSIVAICIYWSLTFSTLISTKFWSEMIFVPLYFKSGIGTWLLKLSAGNEATLLSYQNMYFQNIIYLTLFILIVPLFWSEIREGWRKCSEYFYGVLLIPIIHFGSLLVSGIVNTLVSIFVTLPEISVNQEMIEESMEVSIVGNIFPTIVAAPFVEEIIFRGAIAGLVYFLVFSMISRGKRKRMTSYIISASIAVLISTIGFALLHVVGADKGDYLAMLPYLVSGLLYTSFYFISKRNIMYVILMHMYNNIFALLVFWIASIFG